jgi:hypothetical protein
MNMYYSKAESCPYKAAPALLRACGMAGKRLISEKGDADVLGR